jgi:hypothetical protein
MAPAPPPWPLRAGRRRACLRIDSDCGTAQVSTPGDEPPDARYCGQDGLTLSVKFGPAGHVQGTSAPGTTRIDENFREIKPQARGHFGASPQIPVTSKQFVNYRWDAPAPFPCRPSDPTGQRPQARRQHWPWRVGTDGYGPATRFSTQTPSAANTIRYVLPGCFDRTNAGTSLMDHSGLRWSNKIH